MILVLTLYIYVKASFVLTVLKQLFVLTLYIHIIMVICADPVNYIKRSPVLNLYIYKCGVSSTTQGQG